MIIQILKFIFLITPLIYLSRSVFTFTFYKLSDSKIKLLTIVLFQIITVSGVICLIDPMFSLLFSLFFYLLPMPFDEKEQEGKDNRLYKKLVLAYSILVSVIVHFYLSSVVSTI